MKTILDNILSRRKQDIVESTSLIKASKHRQTCTAGYLLGITSFRCMNWVDRCGVCRRVDTVGRGGV